MTTPLHSAVKARLVTLLETLGPGALLPPERVLAAEYGVSRWTLRQAVRELVAEGRLSSRQGQGTFIAGPKVIQPLALVSYTESLRDQGLRPSRQTVRFDILQADAELATRLGVNVGDPAYLLERILLADDQPIGVETTRLSVSRFPGLRDALDPAGSLYRCLIEEFGVRFGDGEEVVETVLASPREADLLKATQSLPMLLLQRISRDTNGTPIEAVRSLYRGDRVGFRATLRP
ncbi:GntR family transcriptional regulator [Kribbella sp. CA-293567]|uniref:GntR family transcriptional regulator n=1 Tax=Kribbella sp. CA-293567 TaxID=3002436 RepID=UPI0022DD0F74|nr:GntR family transcriptional regulator [Kribbella sp. CA-293567]WBQ04416.1 GntR family transcriptional regulator [Kribbella sp. CA-293567]